MSQTEATLDLVALFEQNKQGKDTIITVVDDPVYHKTKKYKAINAAYLVQNETNLSKIDIQNTKIVFECKDGYKPEMPLELFLKAKPYIAFQDIEAPEGANWESILKNGIQMDAAPFYLIYPSISTKDQQYKWPYNLIKIMLEPLDKTKVALFPKNSKKAVTGYELFEKNCITCHALNGIGGTMGPELNYPKSVTDYWIEKQLVEYIINPAAFRHNVKMPTLGITNHDAKEIVVYLKYMSKYKKAD
ncbi:c-type cytochrome [Flavobacterium sp. 7A]|uniref:c-type cytochrome n=1 Tax=Flavobacterium sp. 7A TaxID=2940571 RepID=UPI0022278386|nr:c-type cytochrome [Flavobacterium sp. 7A]MCW2118540.1 cytochrome c2 [Flavobacterium sp. 7A]